MIVDYLIDIFSTMQALNFMGTTQKKLVNAKHALNKVGSQKTRDIRWKIRETFGEIITYFVVIIIIHKHDHQKLFYKISEMFGTPANPSPNEIITIRFW